MEKQFELFKESEENEKGYEGDLEMTEEGDVIAGDGENGEAENDHSSGAEKPRKKRETIRDVQEQMGYAPFLTEEERKEKKKPGPGREGWLELKKKLTGK